MTCGPGAAVGVADVLRDHVAGLRLDSEQAKTAAYILGCRTGRFGGHVGTCDRCRRNHFSYHSCRNRHCPRCGSLDQALWAEAQLEHLLPVSYFHEVFTLPRSLRPFFRGPTRRYALEALFEAVSQTILETSLRRGYRPGILVVLHTWTQLLELHPHLHCLVTGGGLTPKGDFVHCRRFLVPHEILAVVFKGKLLGKLEQLLRERKVDVGRHCGHELLRDASRRTWNVEVRKPLAGPEQVVRYFARYTHRIAISDRRIVDYDGQWVRFRWRDRKDGNRNKVKRLDGPTFSRRFLQHVLPRGFVRIRRYGLLANRIRNDLLQDCRQMLGADRPVRIVDESRAAAVLRIFGRDPGLCPHCREGRLVVTLDWPVPITPQIVDMICKPVEPP